MWSLVEFMPTMALDGAAPRASAAGETGSRGGSAGEGQPIAYESVASFAEGFDDITLLPGMGWFFQNNSNPLGTTDWFQGSDSVFPAHAGDPTAYIAANFNNTAGVGTISNWMLTPEISLNDGDTISFWTRVPDGSSWPDRTELRLSTAGASTDVGADEFSVGDFDTLLLSVNPNLDVYGYPDVWTQFSATLSGIPPGATGRIAFRYFVTDGGPSGTNSNYIGIDTVEYTGSSGDILPWLSEDPTAGGVDPGTCQTVDVTFDSTGLAPDLYEGALVVSSNDPDEPEIYVPVALLVEECGQDMMYGRLQLKVRPPIGLWGYRAAAFVNVKALGPVPVEGATVTYFLKDPTGAEWTETAVTNPRGRAKVVMEHPTGGPWRACIDDITHPSYTWDELEYPRCKTVWFGDDPPPPPPGD